MQEKLEKTFSGIPWHHKPTLFLFKTSKEMLVIPDGSEECIVVVSSIDFIGVKSSHFNSCPLQVSMFLKLFWHFLQE